MNSGTHVSHSFSAWQAGSRWASSANSEIPNEVSASRRARSALTLSKCADTSASAMVVKAMSIELAPATLISSAVSRSDCSVRVRHVDPGPRTAASGSPSKSNFAGAA